MTQSKSLITEYQKARTILETEKELLKEQTKSEEELLEEQRAQILEEFQRSEK